MYDTYVCDCDLSLFVASPPIAWADELYPRVDLGSWITHAPLFKLRVPTAQSLLDLLVKMKMQ